MSLEQTIRDTLVSESMDLDARLQQLVRAGLMPQNTLPILRKSIAKVQMGLSLQGPERDVMATFINSMMYIVLGDDTIFNKARAGAKSYAAEETEIEEAVGDITVKKVSAADAYKKHTGQVTKKNKVPVDPKTGKTLYQKVTSEEVEDLDETAKIVAHLQKRYGDNIRKSHVASAAKDFGVDSSKLSKAVRKKLGKSMLDEEEQIDEISKKTLASYSDKAVRQTYGNQPHGKDALRKRTNREQGVKAAYNKFFGYKTKVPATEETQIDEISKATMGRYINKAKDSIDTNSWRQGHKEGSGMNPSGRLEKKLSKRHKGIETAVKKLTKEESENLDELSKGTMGSYVNKAAERIGTQGVTAGLKIANDENSKKNFKNMGKRQKGIATAMKKLTKESRKADAGADIAAIKQMNESYKTTFDAALEQYGIKSPSELDEEKRKEFFNFVDQEYKKGDK